MKTKRILYIAGRTVTLFTINSRDLLDTQVYGHDESGLIAFIGDLKATQPHPTLILTDISEEEFHIENLPHVFGNDQRQVLERRISNRFRETRFRYSQKQGRETEGRRDDIFLVSGMTNPEMLDPWIKCLLDEHISIPSIHSLAFVHLELFKRLKLKHPFSLIISQGEMSGMRQTFIVNGQLKISRLTPTRRLASKDYLELAVSETNKFRHFINSTGLVGDNEQIDVTLLGNSDFIEVARQHHINNPLTNFHAHNIDDNTYTGIIDSSHADEFFTLLLANSKLENTYATPKDKRFYYHYVANRAFLTAALLVVFYTVITLPVQILDSTSVFKKLKATVQQQQPLSRLALTAQQNIPASLAPGKTMREAIELHQQVEKYRSSPIPYLKEIGAVLLKTSDITIQNIYWATTKEPHNFPKQGNTPNQTEGNPSTVPKDIFPAMTLAGHIDTSQGIRQAVWQINKLHRLIQNIPGVHEVKVLTYPLEIDSEKTLSDSDNTDSSDGGRKKFSLRIIWKYLT